MPGVQEILNAHLDGKTPFYETEHRLRHKSGDWVWVLVKGRVIKRDADGKPLRACGTHLDITERKLIEEELLRQKALLTSVGEATDDSVFIKDLEGRYLLVNSADSRRLGLSTAQVLGATDDSLYPEEIATQHRQTDQRVITSGEPLNYEQTYRRPGRKTLTYQINKYPRRGPGWQRDRSHRDRP